MPTRTAQPIPPESRDAFLAAARASGPRDHALMLAGVEWGYRISELLSMTVGHVLLPNGAFREKVVVARASLKNGRSAKRRRAVHERAQPISPAVCAALSVYLSGRAAAGRLVPADPLFEGRFPGEPLCRRQVQRLIRDLAVSIGLSPDRTWATRTFRKTYARGIYTSTGHDLIVTQQALGHRHIETTQKYLRVHDDKVQDAVRTAQALWSAGATVNAQPAIDPMGPTPRPTVVAWPTTLRPAEIPTRPEARQGELAVDA